MADGIELGVVQTGILKVRGDAVSFTRDRVAVERPLQIRVRVGDQPERVLSTTMRTPGEDPALAAGFLYAERVLRDRTGVLGLHQLDSDTVLVELEDGAAAALEASARPFVTTAACGVCGRTSLDGMEGGRAPLEPTSGPFVDAAVVHRLPGVLRQAQANFERTGGLHAAGLFAADGALRAVHEDVGRHNAVDKLVGTLLLAGALPASDGVLVVSGRASYELVQKAEAAGMPVLAAVGAPSSAAVERAEAAGMTLLGFVRERGFNVYCGSARVVGLPSATPLNELR
jgi:FdhD protein